MKYLDLAVRILAACLALLMTLVAMMDKDYVPAVIAATAFGVSVPPYRGKANGIRWLLVLCLMIGYLALLSEAGT